MGTPGKCRRALRERLVAASVLFTAVVSFAAAVDTASVEVSPERVVRGRRCTITIRTSIPWDDDVRIEYPDLPEGMVWSAYPYARGWRARSEDGESTQRLVEVLASVRVDEPGFYTLAPFEIQAADRKVLSGSTAIIGLEKDEAGLPYPVFITWRSRPEKIWQGQAVPVVLEARNLTSLALADSVVPSEAPVGLIEEAPGFGGVVTRSYENDILYNVPVASWIWTPGEPGVHRFPGVRSRLGTLNRFVEGFFVEVLPVPEEVQDSGAVGSFRLSVDIPDGPYHSGEILSVRVRVEGEGNMNVLRLPVPKMEGAVAAGRSTSSSFLPGPLGYEGWREERFDFQLNAAGSTRLIVPQWAWFNPEDGGNVYRRESQTVLLKVKEGLPEQTGEQGLPLLGAEAFKYPAPGFQWRNGYWLLLCLPGFVLLFYLFVFRRPRKTLAAAAITAVLLLGASTGNADWSQRAAEAALQAEDGHWDNAALLYEALLEEAGPVPGLLHDMALVRLKQGRADRAVYLMRKAMELRPGTLVFQSSLEILEGQLSLSDQVPVPLKIFPPVVFVFLLVSVNLFFLVLARLLFRQGGGEVMGAIGVFLLLLFALFFSVYTEELWRSPTAVVSAEASALKKIPGPLATNWIQLPAGTAVDVVARENSDVLVRTGYGLEGWLPESSLLYILGDVHGF